MRYGSLTAEQRRIYDETVTGTHSRRIDCLLLDLNGKLKRDLTDGYQGGSLQGNAAQSPAEVFEANVADVDGHLDWRHGRHRHFQLRIVDHRFIPGIGAEGTWVEDVGFEGPIWDFTRQGHVVKIIAQSGERLAMGSVRSVFTRPRKARATAVIDDLLAVAGAKKWQRRIPKLKARLPKSVTIGIDGKDEDKRRDDGRQLRATLADSYFATADRIARALDRELYWDRGRFVLAVPMTRPALWLSERSLLAEPEEKRGKDGETPNRWVVLGHKRPKGKGRRHATVRLGKGHAASSSKMAWNDTPRDITVQIENGHLRSNKACRALGRRHAQAATRELMTYQVQALPVRAWLRPNSLASVPTTSGRVKVRVVDWTVPFGRDADPMTLGVNHRRRG